MLYTTTYCIATLTTKKGVENVEADKNRNPKVKTLNIYWLEVDKNKPRNFKAQ